MDASGAADPSFGVRQFVIGTGGAVLVRLRHDPADERGSGQRHPRRDEVHPPRVELRLAVHPDRRPDVHRLGHFVDSWTARWISAATVADFDGDGDTDVSVFRPSDGGWYIQGQPPFPQIWGSLGDLSVPGDYDGNGTTDIAVFRNGQWYVKGSATTRRSGARQETSPCPATTTATAPPTSPSSEAGSGTSRCSATTRRSGARQETSPCPETTTATAPPTSPSSETGSGTSRARQQPADLGPGRRHPRARRLRRQRHHRHRRLPKRAVVRQGLGQQPADLGPGGDVPVPGDYDGNGTTDIAVFRNGQWYVKVLGNHSRRSGGRTATSRSRFPTRFARSSRTAGARTDNALASLRPRNRTRRS